MKKRLLGFRQNQPENTDPTNDTGKAINGDNRFVDNTMGAAFHDANGTDFDPNLYPTCPSTAGSGTLTGNANQARTLLAIAGAKPPTNQERFWHVHPHPTRKGRMPDEG